MNIYPQLFCLKLRILFNFFSVFALKLLLFFLCLYICDLYCIQFLLESELNNVRELHGQQLKLQLSWILFGSFVFSLAVFYISLVLLLRSFRLFFHLFVVVSRYFSYFASCFSVQCSVIGWREYVCVCVSVLSFLGRESVLFCFSASFSLKKVQQQKR